MMASPVLDRVGALDATSGTRLPDIDVSDLTLAGVFLDLCSAPGHVEVTEFNCHLYFCKGF